MSSIAFPTARSATETTSIPIASEPYAASEPIRDPQGSPNSMGFEGPAPSNAEKKHVETKLLFDLGEYCFSRKAALRRREGGSAGGRRKRKRRQASARRYA